MAMRFEQSQGMKLGQSMKLSPRVIQSMEILQLPLTELEERIEHELEMARKRREEELAGARARRAFERKEAEADHTLAQAQQEAERAARVAYYQGLAELGVDMTAFMTKGSADQVIEVRGGGTPHVHLERD